MIHFNPLNIGRVQLGPTIFSWLGFFVFFWEKNRFGLVLLDRRFQPTQKARLKWFKAMGTSPDVLAGLKSSRQEQSKQQLGLRPDLENHRRRS